MREGIENFTLAYDSGPQSLNSVFCKVGIEGIPPFRFTINLWPHRHMPRFPAVGHRFRPQHLQF